MSNETQQVSTWVIAGCTGLIEYEARHDILSTGSSLHSADSVSLFKSASYIAWAFDIFLTFKYRILEGFC